MNETTIALNLIRHYYSPIGNIMKYILLLFLLSFGRAGWASEDELILKPLKTHMQDNQILNSGEASLITIEMSLAAGYHAYLDKFSVKILDRQDLTVTKFEASPISKFMDVISKTEKEGIKDDGQLKLWIKSLPEIKAGTTDAILELTYQACSEKHCLFPTKVQISTKFAVVRSEITSGENPTAPSSDILNFESALAKGMGFTFLFVFFAGFLTSLTPCIFPMIPITLSIIGASQIDIHSRPPKSRFRSFSLSVIYVLGIAVTYSILGIAAAKTGALFGAALSNPIVVSFIAIVFVVLGLSMYGFYEIQMPAFIRDRLSATKTDTGFIGAFIAGLIAGIVASPCVGPVLVGVLTYVAQTQNALLGFSLLFTFAIGMGMLLIALGTFSGLAGKLPRSGPWMNFTKFIFGTVMIGMAFFYVKPLLMSSTIKIESSSSWQTYNEADFEAAVSSGRPVIVDFYADWCAACKELEKFTFSHPDVKDRLKDYTLFRADLTIETKDNSGLKERFNIIGLPTLHIFNRGKMLKDLTLTGFESKNDFIDRLNKVEK